jgi:acyl phosphate:glycerol-3-phosphate acyltransferase
LCTIKFYPEYYYLSAVVVYLAHIFPVWLKFKGGKGVATFIGIILVINYISFLIFVISWLVVSKLLKISSLSALVAFAILLVSSLFLQSLEETIFYFFFFAFSVFTHRENIARLLAGNEKKL